MSAAAARRWTCPACDREFSRANQSHVCVPGCTVDESFAGRAPVQRAIYEALIEHVRSLGPVHVDAVRIGVFLKNHTKFAEFRPKARCLSLELVLPRRVNEPRVFRQAEISEGRVVHTIKLTSITDVDPQLRAWLTEAYEAG
ncbi:hypothetical protein SAMN05421504_1011108 [Amycolatopsis xylanica]|uniref:DUF5655 domain-containing protein n=1 Tax=Amycolatopsis xylanica TaxID=589385 RepID=A0A1H2V4T8_9PSEU|nr:DUF5655 domain-containing protein [Amycolatopsis xylanica]SDW63308.1 hypothetical protein SAMN05421504_1011108 [Amycolatopsis xylanica]